MNTAPWQVLIQIDAKINVFSRCSMVEYRLSGRELKHNSLENNVRVARYQEGNYRLCASLIVVFRSLRRKTVSRRVDPPIGKYSQLHD